MIIKFIYPQHERAYIIKVDKFNIDLVFSIHAKNMHTINSFAFMVVIIIIKCPEGAINIKREKPKM